MSNDGIFAAESAADQTEDLYDAAESAESVAGDTLSIAEERIQSLEKTVETQADMIRDRDDRISHLESTVESLSQRLDELSNRIDVREGSSAELSDLVRYSNMTSDERSEFLSMSQVRAVTIYRHWDEIAWGPNDHDEYYVDTKSQANAKNNPSKLKYRFEQISGEDLEWMQIYRAMKAVAKLSGGEPEQDEYGRTSITGGRFEYVEQPTADSSKMRRVLKEVPDEENH